MDTLIVGGWSEKLQITSHVQDLCEQLKGDILKALNMSSFKMFKPLEYTRCRQKLQGDYSN